MRTTRVALLCGAAAILLAGYAGIAEAQTPETHVLTLRLPDGQVEQIRYTGDVPPAVVLAPEANFDPVVRFAMLDQLTAAMDREAEALFKEINVLTAPGLGGPSLMPALSGLGFCSRSVQITYSGNDQAPHIVTRTSGDCGLGNGEAAPAAQPGKPEPKQGPDVIQVKAANPYRGLVHPVSDRQR
jgi:hypothetical protein